MKKPEDRKLSRAQADLIRPKNEAKPRARHLDEEDERPQRKPRNEIEELFDDPEQ